MAMATNTLNLYEIYEQNLNFLFGSGASSGFLPTLALSIKDDNGNNFTFETLAKTLEEANYKDLYTLLFMYYYKECIWLGLPRIPMPPFPPERAAVIGQYKIFLNTLITAIGKQDRASRRCNIYTTNYDSCFEIAADDLLADHSLNFTVNDGSSGFQRRWFHTKNFNNRVVQKGIFDRHSEVLPQLNILHPHGSVYWIKEEDGIAVDYGHTPYDIQYPELCNELCRKFSEIVQDEKSCLTDLLQFGKENVDDDICLDGFWDSYNRIPIVNPTKWKFHETVFEEAYYQILRHLSFELERPNSVLITFGFSFSDEHILHLVQRSLSNPTLTVFVCCFDDREKDGMKLKFKGFNNVKFIALDEELTFERFNRRVFTLKKDIA